MGVYDPANNTWRLIPGPNDLTTRTEHGAGWLKTAGVMMIWGGATLAGAASTATGDLVK